MIYHLKRLALIFAILTLFAFTLTCGNKKIVEPPPEPVHYPPDITSISHNPQEPMMYDSCVVSAIVTGHDTGIETVRLHVRTAYSFITNQTYHLADTFFTTIAGKSGGTTVDYYFEAVDSLGYVSVSDTLSYDVPVFRILTAPVYDTVGIDEVTTLTVQLNGVKNAFVAVFNIVFDTGILAVDNITLAQPNLLGDENVLILYGEIDTGVNIGIGRIQTEADDNIAGNGLLLDIVFRGTSSGAGYVTPEEILILDEDGLEVPYLDSLRVGSSYLFVR